MKTPAARIIALLACSLPATTFAARNSADLQPPAVRERTVANGARLWKRTPPPPLPANLVSPFSPTDFDKPDPSELPPTPVTPAAGDERKTVAAVPAQPLAPLGDREMLEKLAAQIGPTGMIVLRGAPRLIISSKPFEVGTRFTATYNKQDYELELVAIDRTTFTLRYRSEETTRPIKPVR